MPSVSVIEEIKERVSIVDVVSAHVPLKKAGRNFKGLCPFHGEKTPSFLVFPDHGNYHCFGCGANGDILSFVMRIGNLAFGDALRVLAERAGVLLPERQSEAPEDQHKARLFEANATAALYFNNLMLRSEAGRAARDYLAKRGIVASTVESFQLGFAPDSWDALSRYMAERGYTPDEMLAAGLTVKRDSGGEYDRFRGRLMFPVRDIRGRVVGFGARALGDEQPKYLNTSQTAIFDKGGSLFGIDLARNVIREFDRAVVVEGYVDALMSHQAGVRNVVACLGTALTERQVALLKRLTKNLVLALDPDAAGDEATLRGLDVAQQVFDKTSIPVPTWRGLIRFERRLDADIRVATLPRGKDPDEIVREDVGAWRSLLEAARPIVDYYFSAILDGADLNSAREKESAVQRLLPLLRDLGPGVQQEHYLQRLARRLRVNERMLQLRLDSPAEAPVTPARERAKEQTREQHKDQPDIAAQARKKHSSLDEYLVSLFLRYPVARGHLFDLDPEALRHEASRQIFSALQSLPAHQDELLDVVCAAVDPELALLAGELARVDEPTLLDNKADQEVCETVSEIRRRNLRRGIEDLSFLLGEAEEGGDAEARRRYIAKHDELLAELLRYEHNNSTARVWRW